MASKVEQQYKLLNAELMDQVQKQRMEIGEYRKRVVALERENMDLREAQVLQNDRQRLENISIVRNLMQRLNLEHDCLVGNQDSAHVVSRPSVQRRSSREICKDMRRTSALARTTRTTSPTRTAPMSSTTSSSSRRSSVEAHTNVEDAIATEERRPTRHTPPPRRPAEMMFDEDESEEESSAEPSPVPQQSKSNEEARTDENQENERLYSIVEENDSGEDASESSSSCEAIYCDTTIESSPPNGGAPATPCGRALREVNTNVPESVSLIRGKETSKSRLAIPGQEEDSVQEPSIQCPRLTVTRPSYSSGSFPDIGTTPRRSLFNGIAQVAGCTSTPKSFVVEEVPSVKSRTRKTAQKKSDTIDTSCSLSTSGRPRRSCRPSSMAEPNLKKKMRNEPKSKAKK
ncbi:shugoshin [Drosophila ficusphila]|uniref:shugoshin n=1 Tax=Drosophila ficusphila TaxID=30025 RepID=UPI0007E86E0D|nr:shugoshin [Drosophila ficusphila]